MTTYQEVVKATFKQHKDSNMTPQEKMKLASQNWKKIKARGGGKKGKGSKYESKGKGIESVTMEGGGFGKDVRDGFMSVVKPAFKIGMALAPML
jgi:hypothetical protein